MTIRFKRRMTSGATAIGKLVRLVWLAGAILSAASLWGQTPSISPSTLTVLGGGGLETATVTVASGASWSASSNAPWITFSGSSTITGTGSGTLVYQVAQNSSSASQTGTITLTSGATSASSASGDRRSDLREHGLRWPQSRPVRFVPRLARGDVRRLPRPSSPPRTTTA